MKTRIITSIIIGLSVLSIFVGIFSNVNISKKEISEEKTSKGTVFKEIFSEDNRLALITLQGPISSDADDSFFGDMYSAENVKSAIKKAYEDNSVKGVLLRINSPGGTVAMSQEIYNSVIKLRKKKPVVVSMLDVAASGGYYIACAADRIYADPGTLTGSIGVIMSTLNFQNLMSDKLGVKSVVIKSGKFKDTGSPYRDMRTDERTLLQNIINSTYTQFVNAIIEGRVKRKDNYSTNIAILTESNLKKYADGRIFTGQQAYKIGLVDSLGGLEEAQKALNEMAKQKFNLKTKNLPLSPYNRSGGLGEYLFSATESLSPKKNIESIIPFSAKYSRQPLLIWE